MWIYDGLRLPKFCKICQDSNMNELSPQPEESTSRPARTLPSKRVLIGAAAAVILLAGLFGFNSWQTNSKFDSEIASIEQLIKGDDLSAAQAAITALQVDKGSNPKLIALEKRANDLTASKSSFEEGSTYLSQRNYTSALDELKKVVKSDEVRFSQAQSKINEATTAYSVQALEEILSLKSKKMFNDALAVADRASIHLTASVELKSLKEELVPLALAETKRAEQAQLAVYRSALKKMRVTTDKFNGNKFYTDRSTPYYADNSKFYIYIGKAEGGDPYLRFEVRYSDDDWLFVESASVNIDGDVRELDVGSEWERDNGSGDIWEWVDVTATESHLSLIKDVIKSKSAVIRYFGSQYRNDRTITSAQKRALQNVLNAYEALKRL